LERGYVLTIDYGYTAADYYSPARSRGTLTCYYRHTQMNNPYVRIGRQDMTAHAEFTSLARAGAAHGLQPVGLVSQEQFLTNLGLGQWTARLRELGLRPAQLQANRMGMLELVQPEGFGRFKVMAQAKGVEESPLWGLSGGTELTGLPVPLRTLGHMPLLEGKYPHEAQEFEAWWPFDKEEE
jgi:SAM-dependent MidA family methyltransferase